MQSSFCVKRLVMKRRGNYNALGPQPPSVSAGLADDNKSICVGGRPSEKAAKAFLSKGPRRKGKMATEYYSCGHEAFAESFLVYCIILTATATATSSSVRGIENQMAFGPAKAGRR